MKHLNSLFLTCFITHLFNAQLAFSQGWMQTSAPNKSWISVASSADGNKLFAVASYAPIYSSTNGGLTWRTNNSPNTAWTSIRSSADGTKIVATTIIDIYTSTNSGADWFQTSAPETNATTGDYIAWMSVASSADGRKLVAASGGWSSFPGSIYLSSDSGMTWTQTSAPTTNWASVASSADGVKLAAVAGYNIQPGPMCLSTNSGASWFESGPTNVIWSSIASSADGSKLIAGSSQSSIGPATIYTSIDSGFTWRTNNLPGAHVFGTWQSVAMSADGIKIAAAKQEGQAGGAIYTSTDSGKTWVSNNVPNMAAQSMASSADGGKLVAILETNNDFRIYISQSTPSPQLNIKCANSGISLGWLVTSTNFILQQSTNFSSWTDITNSPVLNFTNLQSEVMFPIFPGNVFFRLKTP